MHFGKILAFTFFLDCVVPSMAQNGASLISTIQQNSDLSTLNSYINSSTKLSNLFSTSNQFTFLAPTNDAFRQWGNQSRDMIEATIQYHLLNGSYPTVSITESPQFVSTNLKNASYQNVTINPPGQRVELVRTNGQQEIFSNNKTATTIVTKDIICLGGLIQIVSSVLKIPLPLVTVTAQAGLDFFIAILNRANFLTVNDTGLIGYVNNITTTPNLTFLLPNTAQALATFNNMSTNLSAQGLTDLFNYHIISNAVLYSPDLVNGTNMRTVQGSNLTITRNGADVYVNSAKVIGTDYLITNGVIHVLDSLLDRTNTSIPSFIPRASTSSPSPSSSSSSSPSSGLSTGAIVAISVVIPVVFLLGLAAFLIWFFRRRKQRRTAQPQELGGGNTIGGEMDGSGVKREMDGNGLKMELNATRDPGELDGRSPPVEMDGGLGMQPVELDATEMRERRR